jgi:hypothetical protein
MATVTKGKTFVSGETVTPTKLNDLVDNATVTYTSSGDTDNASLEVSGNKFQVKDAGVTPTKLSQPFTRATEQAATSQTSIDFTSIPSWAKRITVMFSGVSTSGTSLKMIQLGDVGGIENTGYVAGAFFGASLDTFANLTAGFPVSVVTNSTAEETIHGAIIFSNISGNTWIANGNVHMPSYAVGCSVAGSKTLSDALDRVRITTVNGTDTFDAGSVNIMYEG